MAAKLKNLSKVVDEMNFMCDYFKTPAIDVNKLTDADAQKIWNRLDSNLSPENLTCDGELRGAAVTRRYKLYTAAQAELKSLGLKFNERSYN